MKDFCLAVTIAMLSWCVLSAGLHGSAFSSAWAQASPSPAFDPIGRYKLESGAGVGFVSVRLLDNGSLNVRIDATASIPGGARDCHFNFNAMPNGNILEFGKATDTACHIRILFHPVTLEMMASEACNNPMAPQSTSGSCEGRAHLINGTYKKISRDPESTD